jgi:hypothetical protein
MSNELPPNRKRALELVLAGRTLPEVAAVLGVNRTTVWKWTQDPGFAVELHQARVSRAGALQEAVGAAALDAVRYLGVVVGDDTAPAGVRVRAACAVLDRAGLTPGALELVVVTPGPGESMGAPDLNSPAGRAAMVEALRALPDGLLREAMSCSRADHV